MASKAAPAPVFKPMTPKPQPLAIPGGIKPLPAGNPAFKPGGKTDPYPVRK